MTGLLTIEPGNDRIAPTTGSTLALLPDWRRKDLNNNISLSARPSARAFETYYGFIVDLKSSKYIIFSISCCINSLPADSYCESLADARPQSPETI